MLRAADHGAVGVPAPSAMLPPNNLHATLTQTQTQTPKPKPDLNSNPHPSPLTLAR